MDLAGASRGMPKRTARGAQLRLNLKSLPRQIPRQHPKMRL